MRLGAWAIIITVVMIISGFQASASGYEEQNYAIPWDIDEDTISVMLLRDAYVQPYKLDIIENTIQSNEKPRSELFRSWNDAINNVNSINNSNIPILQIGNIHNSNYIQYT